MTADKDEIGFEDLGNIEIPPKGDIREEATKDRIKAKITREGLEDEIREKTDTVKEKPHTPIPPDVPKVIFKLVAKVIECPKFELDEEEARTVARHLTILIPFEGKIVSVVVILMVVINKTIGCWEAIKKKFAPAPASAPKDPAQPVYDPKMDAEKDKATMDGKVWIE